jgi:chromate transporter
VSVADLALLMFRLGVLSFGGGITVMPELQRELVDVRGLMTNREFAESYALGQATPGPGMLYLIPVAYHVAGPAGIVVALAAFIVPALLLQLFFKRQEDRFVASPTALAARKALVAMSIGLSGMSVYILARPLLPEPAAILGVVVGVAAILMFRVNPAFVVLGAGVAGAVGVL